MPTVAPGGRAGLVAEAASPRSFGRSRWPSGGALLVRVAELVLERADEIADAIVAETAKPRVEAFTTELFPALDCLAWLARNAPKLLAPERIRYPQLHLKHKRAHSRTSRSASSA